MTSKLVWDTTLQMALFFPPEEQIIGNQLDFLIDKICQKFGFKALIYASSLILGKQMKKSKKAPFYNEYHDRSFELKW